MSPFTRSSWFVWPTEYLVLLFCWVITLLSTQHAPVLDLLAIVVAFGLARFTLKRSDVVYKLMTDNYRNELKWKAAVNIDPPRVAPSKSPWGLQRQVMQMSGQVVANQPQINMTSVLYGALVMEETGETLEALGKAIRSVTYEASDLDHVGDLYKQNGALMQQQASRIRTLIAACTSKPLAAHLEASLAAELLDGVTDMVVVVAGLAEASGLPGEDAYNEVVSSNISKANPLTGVIDKTADGKWIKGQNYRAPDLHAVLLRQPELRW